MAEIERKTCVRLVSDRITECKEGELSEKYEKDGSQGCGLGCHCGFADFGVPLLHPHEDI